MQRSGDGELVMLARSGNKQALAELIERYQPMTGYHVIWRPGGR